MSEELKDMDMEAYSNLRDFISSAMEAKGAEITGGGFGGGVADIEIEIQGYPYIMTLKPRKI